MTMPVAPKPGRTVIADGPAADSLFQRLPVARENERRMRAAQARRNFWAGVAGFATVGAFGLVVLAHFQ